ncbi:DUF6783 domain-containing protein [Robinsoniella peoriensis]|uniref:DUF6783 domain-containing protein n=1 Tax=Robinsoniella peoriensis TaxID=180332 RepID=UPI003A7F5BC0
MLNHNQLNLNSEIVRARACLKILSCHLHAPLCGIFAPNSGYVARYAPFIRDKSPTNCDAQLPEAILKHALKHI